MTNGARSAKDLGVSRVKKRLRDNIQLALGIGSSIKAACLVVIQFVGVIETVYACPCNRTGRQPAGGLPLKEMIRVRMQRVELPRDRDGFRNNMFSSQQCQPKISSA
jgi:hypothetical protein